MKDPRPRGASEPLAAAPLNRVWQLFEMRRRLGLLPTNPAGHVRRMVDRPTLLLLPAPASG